ncbi:axin-1-like [Dendronephthya gigantea]|uniref:axin-1-like n=1 Tax=Dendronephthya gigantea TaxID=151771 RepID=UPI00106A9B3C|nr:axin-1-like [Dendronephthya gigantea]XP_028395430.1 axin-1-like [Dendronephthya gigantea]
MSSDSAVNMTGSRPAPPGQDSDSSVSFDSTKIQSYSAIPRKPSSKESMGNIDVYTDESHIAPLGFEPEGSATKPTFCEGNSSLLDFISDRNGYSLFRKYLQEQNQESLLDFWQACVKFKRLANTGSNLATPTANSNYNNYMHSNHLCAGILQDVIRAKVKHSLSTRQPLSETLFDHAQDCILQYMNDFHYGKFLCSDIYTHSDVSKAILLKDRVSSKNVPRFISKGLPTLPEESVYEQHSGNWPSIDVNSRSVGRSVDEPDGYVPINLNLTKAALAGMFQQPAPPVVSVNHSDVQSLSSDALTDDTKSTVTDFSDLTAKSSDKRQTFQDGFVPRTKKLPKARKQLAPEEFAKILIEKLEKVVFEREQAERTAINLASLPFDHLRENKKSKSILEDAAERHHQYQQFGRLGLLPPKFQEPCYPIHPNSIPSYAMPGFVEHQGMSSYYPASVDGSHNGNPTWHKPEHAVEKRQCAAVPLGNNKKQWESLGTIESAPDSGVSIEEELGLHPDARNRILEWMEHSEKEAQLLQQENFNKPRTKQSYNNPSVSGPMHLAPVAQDPLMPPLGPPDSRNTIEEVRRRLKQKNVREKRNKTSKNRTGYLSSKSSHGTCPQFSGDLNNDCSTAVVPVDVHPAAMYSSSSVLSSIPSTVNSKDSGLGHPSKSTKTQEGTKVIYYLDGEDYPYQSTLQDKTVRLKQFKELIPFKKRNYRYFFKNRTEEEDCWVYEEILDDEAVLPRHGSKIICKVHQ